MPKAPARTLLPAWSGVLALGALLLLGAWAGLTATVLSDAAPPREPALRVPEASALRPQRLQGKYGYVDADGKVVIAPRFDGADSFSEGLAVVLDSGRFGYIDSLGAFAIPAKYHHARAFLGGYAPVRCDGAWLTIDRGGRPVIAALSAAPR